MTERVVLLHGILRKKNSMRGIEKFLKARGYQIINITYASTRRKLEEIIQDIHKEIPHDDIKTNFIGFSMGGLVIRAYLNRYRPINLGRIIMIGTPNQGSEVADFFKNFLFYKFLYGPAGQQLITNQKSFSKIFGLVDYELGIIAGDKTLGLLGRLLIKGRHDGRVSIESSKLKGMKEHIVLPVSHALFLQKRGLNQLIYAFLKTGTFHN